MERDKILVQGICQNVGSWSDFLLSPPPLGEILTRKRSKTFNAPKPVENVNKNSQSDKSHVKGCPCFT